MALSADDRLKVVAQLLFPDAVVMQNVFSVIFEGNGTSFDEGDAIDDIVDWLEAMYLTTVAHIDDEVIADEVFVYVWDAVGLDFDEIGSATWSVTNTATVGMAPHGVAAVVLGRTSDPDVNGKKYIGGLQETSIDDSTLGAVLQTALVAFVADWITPFVGAATESTFTPSIWSPKNSDAYVLTSGVVNAIAGYQRRRKPGVGA